MSEMSEALEGFGRNAVSKAIKKSPQVRSAILLFGQARKMYSYGQKDKAMQCLAKSKKIFESAYEKAKSKAKMIKTAREVQIRNGTNKITDKFVKKTTMNKGMATLLSFLEERIDACDALKMQWDNTAGKASYSELKKKLKEERKAARAEARGKKPANESMLESIINSTEFDAVLESDTDMDEYDEIVMEQEVELLKMELGIEEPAD